MVKAQTVTECADSINTAQACVKECGVIRVVSDTYDNQLLQCLGQGIGIESLEGFENCCNMTSDNGSSCDTSMQNAKTCLTVELSNVRTSATEYLRCLYMDSDCTKFGFGEFCVGILTGGHGNNLTNDFGVGSGSGSDLFEMTRSAETCEDMNDFGNNLCDQVARCCSQCAEKIAGVVNAVMDHILLPAYNSNLTGCGGNKTCSDYSIVSDRQLETVDEPLTGALTANVDNFAALDGLADECNDGLTDEILLYSETYAVSNFFECLSKKMGKIVAESETPTLESDESSSTSHLFGATSMALSSIALTVYAIVV